MTATLGGPRRSELATLSATTPTVGLVLDGRSAVRGAGARSMAKGC
jgi:hypothetical protein